MYVLADCLIHVDVHINFANMYRSVRQISESSCHCRYSRFNQRCITGVSQHSYVQNVTLHSCTGLVDCLYELVDRQDEEHWWDYIVLDYTSAYVEFVRELYIVFSVGVTYSYNTCCRFIYWVKDREAFPWCSSCGQGPIHEFVGNGIKHCGVIYICICMWLRMICCCWSLGRRAVSIVIYYLDILCGLENLSVSSLAEEWYTLCDEPTQQYRCHDFCMCGSVGQLRFTSCSLLSIPYSYIS